MRALAAWGYDPAAPPEDGAGIAGGLVRHRRIPIETARHDEPAPVEGREPAAIAAYEAAVAALRAGSRAPLRAPSGLDAEGEQPGTGEDAADARIRPRSRDLARAAGIALHRALRTWDGEDEAALRAGVARGAREAALAEDVALDELAPEAAGILEAFLRSPLADLFHRVEKLGREVPLLLAGTTPADPVWRGSLDLLYRDADGRLVVADYKTDREDDPDELARRYGGRLGIYVQAVARALEPPRPPRAELWMLRTGRRVEL
jgi:ATP-dependent exoDNAse (exonuclease V) beta subunit